MEECWLVDRVPKRATADSCRQWLRQTEPLTLEGEPAARMVGVIRRHRLAAIDASMPSRAPHRDRLRWALGVADPRVRFMDRLERH